MPKNIVICCDGTNGEFRAGNTNVVRLYAMLVQDPATQVAFYDPGLGTMSPPGALTRTEQEITRLFGLAFGYGLATSIGTAYVQLMNCYEAGDRVFLFGFSRGAYTVRALAGLIHMFGLLRPGNDVLVPYETRMFRQLGHDGFRLADEFKRTFGRDLPIHFVGVWDTVSSVGWIYDPVKLPYTRTNVSILTGRHAVSIDERRCFFRQNRWSAPQPGQDLKEVWFAGVHSDVGGGYPSDECGLANITLEWMTSEAARAGLLVRANALGQALSPPATAQASAAGFWRVHESLAGPWWAMECLPKRYCVDVAGPSPTYRWKIPLGERRFIPDGALIHQTALSMLGNGRYGYHPRHLPGTYGVEPAGQVAPP